MGTGLLEATPTGNPPPLLPLPPPEEELAAVAGTSSSDKNRSRAPRPPGAPGFREGLPKEPDFSRETEAAAAGAPGEDELFFPCLLRLLTLIVGLTGLLAKVEAKRRLVAELSVGTAVAACPSSAHELWAALSGGSSPAGVSTFLTSSSSLTPSDD